MALKFHIHSNIDQALTKRLATASNKAEHIVAIKAEKDTRPFVPALTLQFANDTKVEGAYIIYPGPRARMLYNGKLMIDPATGSAWARKGATKAVTGTDLKFNHAVHSRAQAYWFEASKAQNLDKWLRVAGRAMKREI